MPFLPCPHAPQRNQKIALEKDEAELISDLVKRYLKSVYNFALRLVNDREAAEDIAQETFIKTWKNLGRFETGRNFKTWLLTIAHNTAIDWLRKKRVLVFSDFENDNGDNSFVDSIADPTPLPEEMMAQKETGKLLEKALVKLSLLDREILTLHYEQNLTFEEIGQILNQPLNTVKSRHHRALATLRKFLN